MVVTWLCARIRRWLQPVTGVGVHQLCSKPLFSSNCGGNESSYQTTSHWSVEAFYAKKEKARNTIWLKETRLQFAKLGELLNSSQICSRKELNTGQPYGQPVDYFLLHANPKIPSVPFDNPLASLDYPLFCLDYPSVILGYLSHSTIISDLPLFMTSLKMLTFFWSPLSAFLATTRTIR